MALEGNLSDFTLADMFNLLSGGGKTGVLHAADGDMAASVCFLDGSISLAEIGESEGRLSQDLTALGIVTAKQLRQALGLQKIQRKDKAGRTLGRILVDEGYVDGDALEAFVLGKVADVVFELSRWTSGTLRFEADVTCPADDIGFPISVTKILAEVDRRVAVWDSIKERIPDVDARFTIASSPAERTSEIRVSPREWALLCHLHGSRSLREVMERTGLDEFDAAESMSGMLEAGLIERVDETGRPMRESDT